MHRLTEALKKAVFEYFETILNQSAIHSVPKGLTRVLRIFKKYLPAIKETCRHPHLTNGPIEGINNKIKVLKRTAYGYGNYSHFRNRILLISRLYVSGRDKKRSYAAGYCAAS
ncbi:transposase [Peptococcus simiae]|uniref:transposase n=1 Tax=Peptococcus simiae TaxID=1643805 RepID=UPI003981508B